MEVPYGHRGIASSSSSSSNAGDSGPHGPAATKRRRADRRQRTGTAGPALSSSSANSSLDFSAEMAATEEEDMAHCLILLARGHAPSAAADAAPEKFASRRFNETATTAGGKAGFYAYECKTCNKCFPTFQALGGHRASHKKPKIAAAAAEEDKFVPPFPTNRSPVPADADTNNNKWRVHGCSICGAEFSSGQALGGHMRRHRPIVVPSTTQNHEMRKSAMVNDVDGRDRNNNIVLALDLNLPAPCDEVGSSPAGFTFAAATSGAAALVDCRHS